MIYHFPFGFKSFITFSRMRVIFCLILSVFVADCASDQAIPTAKTYLALGDSYTIGESVAENERWPVQLVKRLNDAGVEYSQPKIIARTGWRTDDLLSAMDSELGSEQYDLVSLLIGVNNQFQGRSLVQYKKDLLMLCERSIAQCKTGVDGVFAVSIPDYGATPFGQGQAETIGTAIDEWNAVFKKVCGDFDIPFYNITDISRQAPANEALIASDGLHPSGKMYKLWVDRIIAARW